MNIPIIKTLEANIAVRYDHYSDFGSTTNPKVSLRWQPIPSLLLRGSYGTGFLAPSLYQLWTPETPGLSQTGVSDPLRCPNPDDPASGSNPDCNTQYTATFGGNPNLKPEKTNQTTVGMVWEPLNGASIGVDWFYINLKDIVTNGVPISTILSPATDSLYSSLVTRAATCAGGQPCPITAIAQNFVNIGKEKIQGIDLDMRFTSPSTDFGRFRALITGTYYISYEASQPDGSFAGFVSNAYRLGGHGHHAALEELCRAVLGLRPLDGNAGQQLREQLHRRQYRPGGNLRRVGEQSRGISKAPTRGSRTGR